MFSPAKITLFAFLSFASLALAIPTSDGRSKDPKALISRANTALVGTMLPLSSCYLPFRLYSRLTLTAIA